MRVIHAVWEKRNLGVEAYEIQIDGQDKIADIEEKLEGLSAPYIAVKVPGGMCGIGGYLQENGYHYIEDIIGMEHDLREMAFSPMHQRLYRATSYRRMGQDDVRLLYEEIRKGMFDADRISQDAAFGKELSANRYCNWISDLLEKGAMAYVVLYKEDPTGFVILRTEDGKSYQSVLGGAYSRFRKTGLGAMQKEQEIVRKLGGKKITTNVSSNNLAQLKSMVVNGYVPSQVNHVFVKHG